MDNDNFEGMLFTLKKRLQHIEHDDAEYYKYRVLGFYDGLDINVISQWYDFRPAGLNKKNLQVNLNAPFLD